MAKTAQPGGIVLEAFLPILGSGALLLTWAFVGAPLALCIQRRLRVPGFILVAPVMGLSVVALSSALLSRVFNWSSDSFAAPLTALLVLSALVWLILLRPDWQFRTQLLLAALSLGVLAVLQSGSLWAGFGWLSYGNDDGNNYILGAIRFMEFGYQDAGQLDRLFSGEDYSQVYYWFHVVGSTRSGGELTLAWASSLFRIEPFYLLMPMMAAISAVVAITAAGLVTMVCRSWGWGLIAIPVVALAPQAVLGTEYQLLGQVGGLAFLLGTTLCVQVLLAFRETSSGAGGLASFDSDEMASLNAAWRTAFHRSVRDFGGLVAALVLLATALILWYPEIAPFGFLGFALTLILTIARKRLSGSQVLALTFTGIGLLGALVSLAALVDVWRFLANQATVGATVKEPAEEIFSYYLVPTGLAALWGFTPFASGSANPLLMQVLIALGFVVFLAALTLACWWAWRLQVAASVLLLLLLAFVTFALRGNGFATFKIAMWISPLFLVIVFVAIGTMGRRRRQTVSVVIGTGLLLLTFPVTFVYLQASFPGHVGPPNEVSAFTPEMLDELHETLDVLRNESDDGLSSLLVEDFNHISGKMVAARAVGHRLNLGSYGCLLFGKLLAAGGQECSLPGQQVNARFGGLDIRFRQLAVDDQGPTHNLILPSKSVINRDYAASLGVRLDVEEPRLVFVPSSLGQWYFSYEDRGALAFTQPETDPVLTGSYVQAAGQYALFRISNYRPGLLLRVAVSSSYTARANHPIPSVRVIGDTQVTVPFVGWGSGRALAKIPAPKWIGGQPYILVDFGSSYSQSSQSTLRGLLSLYGSEYPSDGRSVSVYVRDLSVVESQRVGGAPTATSSSMTDLLTSDDFIYSGVFEDGWLSPRVEMNFSVPPGLSAFEIEARAPVALAGQRVRIFLGGTDEVLEAWIGNDGRVFVQSQASSDFTGLVRVGIDSASESVLSGDSRPLALYPSRVGFLEE